MTADQIENLECPICNQSFGHKSSWKRHAKAVCENEKPFTCLICNQSFGQKSSMKKHIKTVHENEKPFTCLICKK